MTYQGFHRLKSVSALSMADLCQEIANLKQDLDRLPAAFSFDQRLHRIGALRSEVHRRQIQSVA